MQMRALLSNGPGPYSDCRRAIMHRTAQPMRLAMNMIYTPTARFDTGRALTESELFKLAPSVFATTAHESRSERFAPIPTIEIVRGLAKEGFGVVGAKQ